MNNLAIPTTDQHLKGFMSMSVTMDLTAKYHPSTRKVFLGGSVTSADYSGPNQILAILLDVDQAKALINELTVAVTR